MKYKYFITPIHILIISFQSISYLFFDINPFNLIFIYSYLILYAIQIFWAKLSNNEDSSNIIWTNFNSVFVLSIFIIIYSYYYRLSILMILLLPLIHIFFVKFIIKYELVKFQIQKLEFFFFILFSTVFIPLTSYEYNGSRAMFFTLIFFIFGFFFYSVYYKLTMKKLLLYQNLNEISWLSFSSFLYAYLLSASFAQIPLFLASRGIMGYSSNVNYIYESYLYYNEVVNYYEFVNNIYYTYFISIFYFFLLILQIGKTRISEDHENGA